MTTYARIQNNVAIEIFIPPAGLSIDDCFHADVAAQFTVVPDGTVVNSALSNGIWTTPPVESVPPTPAVMLPLLTPMTLYMAFTPAERIAIKASTDPMVVEFWAMYQLSVQLDKPTDPNLISVQEAMQYLAQTTTATPPGPGILASQERVQQILAGIPQ